MAESVKKKARVASDEDARETTKNTIGTIEWELRPWSSLSLEHVVDSAKIGRTCRQILAAGHIWQIQVMRGGYSNEDDTAEVKKENKEHVGIFLQ